MANRVFDTLARLDRARRRRARRGDPRDRRAARSTPSDSRERARLFAAALETPGGLKVQTIHAFCTRLLQQFPFEANVAGALRGAGRAASSSEIARSAPARRCCSRPRAEPDSATGRALATAIAAGQRLHLPATRCAEAIGERDRCIAWVDSAGGVDAAIGGAVGRARRSSRGETLERVEARDRRRPAFCRSANGADGRDSCAPAARATRSRRALAARRWPRPAASASTAMLCGLLHRRRQAAQIASSPRRSAKRIPSCSRGLPTSRRASVALLERRRAVLCRDRTMRAADLADAVIAALSRREGPPRPARLRRPDRQDAATCSPARAPAWVHYKLDLGIDHVLIDEAQDTSPEQWDIVERLVAEFAAGAGARGAAQAHDLRGRRRQAVDLLVPGRGAGASSTSRRGISRRRFDAAGTRAGATSSFSIRSARAPACSARSTRCSGRSASYRRRDRRRRRRSAHHARCRTRRPGLVEIWPLVEPDDSASDRRLGRAVRRHRRRRARR